MSLLQNPNTETSPLVVKPTEKNKDDGKGQATVIETILNLCKTCCGTGCLALPYAAQSGGIFVFGIGLLFLGLWNVYAVERLVRCRTYLVEAIRVDEEEGEEIQSRVAATGEMESSKPRRMKFPKESTSTLGKVAFFAFGPAGLEVMDILMTILLLGIVISYLSAVISFLSDTPLTIGPLGDALVIASLMAILSLVPDMGHLSGISGTGLLVLAGAFIVIAGYGLYSFLQTPTVSLPIWPASAIGLSHFFGVCVFGFGGKWPTRITVEHAFLFSLMLSLTCTSCSPHLQLPGVDERTKLNHSNHCWSAWLRRSFLHCPWSRTFDFVPQCHRRNLT